MTGYDTSELLGQNIRVLTPPTVHDNHDSLVQRFLSTGVSKFVNQGPRSVSVLAAQLAGPGLRL